MSTQSIKFCVCSLTIHCAMFWLMWQQSPEYGVARGVKNAMVDSAVLTARFVANEKTSTPRPGRASVETKPGATPASPAKLKETAIPAESDPATATFHDNSYLAAGRLTRLPAPVSEIDLNIDGINDVADIGKIELTLLVNEAGIVVDVEPAFEFESARAVATLIAERFRTARFMPGEINGKAVKSQLRITVVSENLPISISNNSTNEDKNASVM